MKQNSTANVKPETPDALPDDPNCLKEPAPETPSAARRENLPVGAPRKGKPPSPKTLAIRRAIEALGGLDAADPQQVIDRLRQEGVEASSSDVSIQKAALKRLADDAHARGGPGAGLTLTAQDIRDFTALLRRVGVEGVRALLEMAEAMR